VKYIIGINAFHANSSVCLIKNNQIVFAVEEERFNRIKNWYGFPTESLNYIINKYSIKFNEVEKITFNFNKNSSFFDKLFYLLTNIKNTLLLFKKKSFNKKYQCINELKKINFYAYDKIYFVDHHLCHLNYSLLTSNYNEALCISVDGFGDFLSSRIALFRNNKLKDIAKVKFPHSLGIFYQSITQYLGYKNYGDEYKVMGLSAYGNKYIDFFDELVSFSTKNLYKLNLKYFNHYKINPEIINSNGSISYLDLYNENLKVKLKKYNKENIAYSLQKKYEDILFNIINFYSDRYQIYNLCLSGGCALNSLANGKIYENTKIKSIHISSTPHDAGGSLGSALTYIYNKNSNFRISHSNYLGPKFSNDEIKNVLKDYKELTYKLLNEEELIINASKSLAEGKIIGWFQDSLEWGPRSLGNRSILANPSISDMKDKINKKIKRRESFRPFAPSIIKEEFFNWFDAYEDEPFMIKVYKFKKNKLSLVPSVCHVDNTGRVQTVSKQNNLKYYNLIKSFFDITSIPMLLNTSFNENEPVVCSPTEAVNCFIRNDIDEIYIQNYIVTKK